MKSKRITHRFIPNSVEEIEGEILAAIGVSSLEELFSSIPKEVRLKRKLEIPYYPSEFELKSHCKEILDKNVSADEILCFLGAGIYNHYIPSVVKEIIGRAEFSTAYTPYQPEVSQGVLQSLFEYQSMICELTGMDYANCSMYDGASALGEACRMSIRANGKRKILIPKFINPERFEVLKTYVEPLDAKIAKYSQSLEDGQADLRDIEAKLGEEDVTCLYMEQPSYFGYLEQNLDEISERVHKKGALLIMGIDPISLGIFREPSSYQADIVVGEGQALGLSMNYGGPLLGILAARGELLLRQMPGRIVGMTTTQDGRFLAFCNVLQTREQHIRRERATSNICTNEALMAIASAVFLSLLGPQGLKDLAECILAKTSYAIKRLSEIKGIKVPSFNAIHFKEFLINYQKKDCYEIHKELLKRGIHGGKIVREEFPELGNSALYCVTEVIKKEHIDTLASNLEEVIKY
ncbi:MAG: aminomethyl-transferring glycine dehydrogenase subunit GcvPA [Nitrososphaerales archaeon]